MSEIRMTHSVEDTMRIQGEKLQQQLQLLLAKDARIFDMQRKIKALEDLAAHRMQSINGLIAEKEALQEVNEQLAHELNMHRPHTDMLADLAAYCVQREIGQSGQNAHEAIMAHCDVLQQENAKLHGRLNDAEQRIVAEQRWSTDRLRGVRADAILRAVCFFKGARDIDVEALKAYAAKIRQGGE